MVLFQFDNYSLPNPMFEKFGSNHFSAPLFLCSLLQWSFSLPGLLFNPCLLFVTLRDLKLRGSCSLLLSIGSLCDFFYLLAQTPPFLLALTGINFAPLLPCFLLQFVPNIGLFSSVWIVFFVGMDRLLAVLLPFWYTRLEKNTGRRTAYITLVCSVTFGYSLCVMAAAFPVVHSTYPNRAVRCQNSDAFAFGMSSTLLRNGLLINGASFIVYLLVGVALRRYQSRVDQGIESGGNHHLWKSLAAIMTLVVGTYFGICAIRLLTASITAPFFTSYVLPSISTLFTCTAATSNPPLLYVFSKEYRRAFRAHYPMLRRVFGHDPDETTTTAVVTLATANKAKGQKQTRTVVPAPNGTAIPNANY